MQIVRRYRSGRCQVGEGVGDRCLRLVYAVTHSRSLAGVNKQRKQRVHRIILQRPAAACLVGAPIEGRLLDLKEAVGSVRSCDVDHQVVGQQQLGQGMDAIRAERPVSLAIQAIEECEVGVQPGTVGLNEFTILLVQPEKFYYDKFVICDFGIIVSMARLLRPQR